MKYKTTIPLCVLLLSVLVLSFLPYVAVEWKLGGAAFTVPVGAYSEGDYYYDRIQEIKDGHPLLGNPYFYEYRNEITPAFFLADWIGSVPSLLGLSLLSTTVLNFCVWSLFLALLLYLFFKRLGLPRTASALGSFFVYAMLFVFIVRAVSMQIVFPFFLLFLFFQYVWLTHPRSLKNNFWLGFSGALAGTLYTYSLLVVVTTLFLTGVIFVLKKEKEVVPDLLKVGGIFIFFSLPLFFFTTLQLHNPYYWETMARIGLVFTHLPTMLFFTSSFWIFAMFGVWAVLYFSELREWCLRYKTDLLFWFVTGTSLVLVSGSNIITGKDLETSEHLERYVILWLGLAFVWSLYRIGTGEWRRLKVIRRTAVITLLLVAFFGSLRYISLYGPEAAWSDGYGIPTVLKSVQEFERPLGWLNTNVPERSVIWTNSDNTLNNYVAMLTHHYSLFKVGGILHLMPSAEAIDRYLTAKYFHLTEDELIAQNNLYEGAGNAIHQYKTQNRRVWLCRLFFGKGRCGPFVDLVTWRGQAYFDALYKKYTNDIRPHILEQLKKYHVAYAVRDLTTDRYFDPSKISGATLVYQDPRFLIYSFSFNQ